MEYEYLDLLYENADIDLLEMTEYYSIINEYKMSDAILNKNKLKDEEYVKRQIKNIKERNHPLTAKETLFYLAAFIATVYTFPLNFPVLLLVNVALNAFLSGGFTVDAQDEKVKRRMLKSIDEAISKAEKAKLKDNADKKKVEEQIEKLKKNRELVEKKLK